MRIDPGPCDGTGPTCGVIEEGTPTFDKKQLRWPLKNGGATKVTLTEVTVTWPASNGYLSKIKLEADVIWDGTINCATGTCTATFTTAQLIADANKRSIDHGKTKKLIFEFQNDANKNLSLYYGSASFGTGCEVFFGTPPTNCTGTIGNFVWNDTNGNGIQDSGEPGISGVTLTLKDDQGAILGTTTTGTDGKYLFTKVCDGTYSVEVAPPFGYTLTTTGAGTPDTDSNPNPATGIELNGDDDSDLTIDFGFKAGGSIPMCPTTPIAGFGPGNPCGLLTVTDLGNGTVKIRFEQNTGLNDNSYGTNQVGWGANAPSGSSHTFSNLSGSDSAQFTFYNGAGTKVLDFEIDYISAKAGTPSGYGTLGVAGGDGGMLTGAASNVLFANTSLDKNLNSSGFCVLGNCSGGGTNLLVNSPPTVSSTSYTLPAGSPYGAWDFTNWYEVVVSKALLTGSWRLQLGTVHNSPPKAGTNAVVPTPCK